MSTETPPTGYEIVKDGALKEGDIFFSAQYDFDGEWLQVMSSHYGKPIPANIPVARKSGDAMTGYFAFTDDGEGDYRAVEFYGDQQPTHDELMELAEQMGKKIVLIQGQIVDEVSSQC